MNNQNYIKKLTLSDDVEAPMELHYQDIIAKPLTRNDLLADIQAVNSSLNIIRTTRGGSWPQGAVTEEFDFLDLAWHEREFRNGDSFAYVVYDDNGIYIGCFYLYGIGGRTTLTDELSKYEVDASWWVTQSSYHNGYYKKLKHALDIWLQDEFRFKKVYYSNIQLS